MMNDRFEKLIDAMHEFYTFDRLENYKDDSDYGVYCDLLSSLYFEMASVDTIDKVDLDD